jgi:squalene-hopene/tetraprenyl-beta-curcumene cyclase
VRRSAASAGRAGVAFLLERQDEDGLWRDFETLAGASADWVTGYVGVHLRLAGAPRSHLDRAARALLERQREDGGWGYHEGVPTDADSTAYAGLFLACGRWAPPQAAGRVRRCLERHRQGGGGVATYAEERPIREYMELPADHSIAGWCRAHVEVSAAAGLALAALGGDGAPAWGFVRSRQRPEGRWESYWWALPHYPTAVAVALATRLQGAAGAEEAAARAVRWLAGAQHDDGTWPAAPGGPPDAFATALAVGALARAGGPADRVARGAAALAGLADADGGWTAEPALQIPPPDVEEPGDVRSWRTGGLGTAVVVGDGRRLYTTATAVGALASAAR